MCRTILINEMTQCCLNNLENPSEFILLAILFLVKTIFKSNERAFSNQARRDMATLFSAFVSVKHSS